MSVFKKATRHQSRLRLALIGASGSGKSYSALRIARGIGGRIAVIDTERGSASKYAGDVADFDSLDLEEFSPRAYIAAIGAAEAEGYDVLVIDSLSHAWMGKGGALEMVDQAAKRSQSGNNFAAWRDVTPLHNALVDAILRSGCHVIATMRSKTEYVQEKNDRGKTVIRKVGMAPVQRDGLEYEFDVVGDMDCDHNLLVTKTRCSRLAGAVIPTPGEALGRDLLAWLSDGQAPAAPPAPPAPPAPGQDRRDPGPGWDGFAADLLDHYRRGWDEERRREGWPFDKEREVPNKHQFAAGVCKRLVEADVIPPAAVRTDDGMFDKGKAHRLLDDLLAAQPKMIGDVSRAYLDDKIDGYRRAYGAAQTEEARP